MEEKLKSKSLYKILLGLLKFLPALTALIYFINSILSLCGIETTILSIIGGQSILSIIFMYIASYVFKFCSYHRVFLHYILCIDILNYYDYYIGLPIENKKLIILISLFTLIIIMKAVVEYLKTIKDDKYNKESTSSINR